MNIDFDPTKSEKNAHERGLPFERVAEFDWEGAVFSEDSREQYSGVVSWPLVIWASGCM